MKIRSAKVDDAQQIAQVHVQSWQAAYEGLLPEPYLDNLSVGSRVQQWTNGITNSPTLVDVCEEDDQIVGFVASGRSRGNDAQVKQFGEIYSIYLVPKVWDQGYGQALLDVALHQLQNDGYIGVVLWVLEGNERAIQFYKRNGFSPDGNTTQEELAAGVIANEVRYIRRFTISL